MHILKRHDTSSLRNHIFSCNKNPLNKDIRQSYLTLKLVVDDSDASENVGVLVKWKFDKDLIRNKFSEIVIVDDLPSKFVEGEGFKKFMFMSF